MTKTKTKTRFHTIVLCLGLPLFSFHAAAGQVEDSIAVLQTEWATVKYRTEVDLQADHFLALADRAATLAASYPDRAEPLVWEAICLSNYAGAVGGIKSVTRALPAVKEAKGLLEKARAIDDGVLDGSVYTTLGSLYYQVPGWPIGYGDKKVAREYLERAMRVSQNKLTAGYYYGDFLFKRKEYQKSLEVLEAALKEPRMANRPLADEGLRMEIRQLLEQVRVKVSA